MRIIILLFLLITSFGFSQESKDDSFKDIFYAALYSGNWTESDSLLDIKKNKIKTKNDEAKYNWYVGYYMLQKGEYLIAFKTFKLSREYYKKNYLFKDQVRAESRMIECIYLLDNRNPTSKVINLINIDELINSTCEIANKTDDPYIKIHCEYNKSTRAENLKDFETSLIHIKNMSQIYLEQKDTARYMANLLNVAPTLRKLNKYQEAISILNIAENYFSNNKKDDKRRLFLIYVHKSDQYINLKKNDSALINLDKAQKLLKTYKNLNYEIMVYEQLVDIYENQKKYKKSFDALKIVSKLKDSVQYESLIKDIGDIKTKYETAEKEKENLILKNKQQGSTYKIYGLLGLFLLTAIGSFGLYSNSKKKQLITIKEKELETERADKILKYQELQSIDDMIFGQEKERKRIAEDLHDDLGSSLATVRLYMNNLKEHVKSDNIEIVEKTESLLNDAYEKIRLMSHIRQGGTLASQGFIPAIEDLASKISESNKLLVEVAHHVKGKSLENSLELNLFRIIQELLNNIIKHANAKHATINITAFDDTINILIEDDGCGFDESQIEYKKGIGLKNIKERIAFLKGEIKIDSKTNQGTAINIDIPI